MKENESSMRSNKYAELQSALLSAIQRRFPNEFQIHEPVMHLVDVRMDQDPDAALEQFRKTHETFGDDLFILSYLTFDEAQFEARNIKGQEATVFLDRNDVFTEKLRLLEQAPPPPQAQDSVENTTDQACRDNLDWLIESVDRPGGIPPKMMARVLKSAEISRSDMWRPRKKRY